jgi:hypothetical protein
MRNYDTIGIQIPQIYLPKEGIDLTKWAVIACDQFTLQPEYWAQVKSNIGDAPSTLNLILPEVYLDKPGLEERVARIHAKMREYLDKMIFTPYEGMIYVERTVDGKTRKGIMVCLDLEHYDYTKNSKCLIRATEDTILERILPRMRVREGALLELPHILVLIDDPQYKVIEPLSHAKYELPICYDFDLMLVSGHLTGYLINVPGLEAAVISALNELARPEVLAEKYGDEAVRNGILFAVGDGNHSMAAAKANWEKIKPQVGRDHPARYALVEIENLHDQSLVFEPIHRILLNTQKDIFAAMQEAFGSNYSYSGCADRQEMIARVVNAGNQSHVIGVIQNKGYGVIRIDKPSVNLPVGSLQIFLDSILKEGGAEKIDYVHGDEVVFKLGVQPGNIGFFLPVMPKSDLFKTVILDGALPRKTFSMGEARGKRFYMESRKIL